MSESKRLSNEDAWAKFIEMINGQSEFGKPYTKVEMQIATGRSKVTIDRWVIKAQNGLKPSWAGEDSNA